METGEHRVVSDMTLPELPVTFVASRDALQRVAVHVVARASVHATGRISLRSAPGGLSTTALGEEAVRVRLADGLLVRESEAGDSSAAAVAVDGASLAALAEHAGVDLAADLYVGRDTPPLGDVDEPLAVDPVTAHALGAFWSVAGLALDRVVGGAAAAATPSAVRLWPEHFRRCHRHGVRPRSAERATGQPGGITR